MSSDSESLTVRYANLIVFMTASLVRTLNSQPSDPIILADIEDPKLGASVARIGELLAASKVPNVASVLPSCQELAHRVECYRFLDKRTAQMTTEGFAPWVAQVMDVCAKNSTCARLWDDISSKRCREYAISRGAWDYAWQKLTDNGRAPAAP